MDPGSLIAINVLLLYTILGPLVLFAIYVLFDSLANLDGPDTKQHKAASEKGPAVWKDEEINTHMNRI